MNRRTVAFASSFVVLCCVALTLVHSMRAGSPKNPADFNRLVDNYFDFYFQFHPKEATAAGFHQYDAKLEDYSRASREGEISNLRTFRGRVRPHRPGETFCGKRR